MLTVEKLTTLKAYAKLILYIFENGYECNFRAVFTLFFALIEITFRKAGVIIG